MAKSKPGTLDAMSHWYGWVANHPLGILYANDRDTAEGLALASRAGVALTIRRFNLNTQEFSDVSIQQGLLGGSHLHGQTS